MSILTFTPVVSGPATMIAHEEVLRVVEVRVEAILDAVDDSRFQVDQYRPGYVVLIVRLVEEHIFPIVPIRSVLFQDALPRDAMLQTQLLPELVTDYRQRGKKG